MWPLHPRARRCRSCTSTLRLPRLQQVQQVTSVLESQAPLWPLSRHCCSHPLTGTQAQAQAQAKAQAQTQEWPRADLAPLSAALSPLRVRLHPLAPGWPAVSSWARAPRSRSHPSSRRTHNELGVANTTPSCFETSSEEATWQKEVAARLYQSVSHYHTRSRDHMTHTITLLTRRCLSGSIYKPKILFLRVFCTRMETALYKSCQSNNSGSSTAMTSSDVRCSSSSRSC